MLFIQHVRADTAHLVTRWLECGGDVAGVIAIPYSFQREAGDEIEKRGVRVETPSLERMQEAIEECVTRALRRGRPWIVQDVGGYFADYLRSHRAPELLLGVVEETKQGLWRYGELDDPNVSIVQIADSDLKKIEALHVGAAVVGTVVEILRTRGERIVGHRIGVVGFGDIGSACAQALRGLGNEVVVMDVSPIKRIAAASRGYAVSATASALLSRCRVVIGCTGKASVRSEDFAGCAGSYLLFSASSRAIEFEAVMQFEILGLAGVAAATGRYGDVSMPLFRVAGCEVCVVNDGRPVNFLSESLPDAGIDLVFSQLVAATARLASRSLPTGVSALASKDLEDIAELWLQCWTL